MCVCAHTRQKGAAVRCAPCAVPPRAAGHLAVLNLDSVPTVLNLVG
eukprot:SAG31_NODE_8384_length_1462_cov_1.432135_1_plen_46_part_00